MSEIYEGYYVQATYEQFGWVNLNLTSFEFLEEARTFRDDAGHDEFPALRIVYITGVLQVIE